MHRSHSHSALIVGGGPAGMAAAYSAAQSGSHVAVVDENPTPGGQIWRGGPARANSRTAVAWFKRLEQACVEVLCQTQVVDRPRDGVLLVEQSGRARELEYATLILATGARERFLPFPGWTLPNVMGAGGLQALVKSGYPIEGKRVAVAGSGPLLLAVAALLRRQGAIVPLVAEQAPWGSLARFAAQLISQPGKLLQGAGYRLWLLGARYATSCWPVAAEGEIALRAVTFRTLTRKWTARCDYLACGFGFVPNLELPLLVGCELQDGTVRVDPWQETSVKNVYCAGQSTGIGGVDQALIEGRIAGYAAAGNRREASRLFRARSRAVRFARALDRAFALRGELRQLAAPETIVCRCEDVTRRQLDPYTSWQAAKLQTRCGMGPCQGRVCGGATEVLFGWKPQSVRPPIYPTSVEILAKADTMRHQDSGQTSSR